MGPLIAIVVTSSCFLASNLLLAPVLRLIRTLRRRRVPFPGTIRSISIVVPAYNEEHAIRQKINSLREALRRVDVNYEVLIGSDGSTDRTVEIVSAHLNSFESSRWRLLEFANLGKCGTINQLVAAAGGEVVVSTDADIPVPADCIQLVIRAFRSNGRLGCLSCVPWFEGLNIGGQHTYWSIEDQIRAAESELGRLIVVTGMFFAFRRDLFERIPDGVMADDLWIPLNVLLKGFESVQIGDLRIRYEPTDEETEIRRRKRVIVGGMDVVRRLWRRLFEAPSVLVLLLIHKVNRWAFPIWLSLLLLAVAAFMPAFLLGYALAIVAMSWHLGPRRFLVISYAFVTPFLSLADVFRKRDVARWEHIRRH
jgi:poly-beta-1,6-N-acetyl-D-glucosamine synthase